MEILIEQFPFVCRVCIKNESSLINIFSSYQDKFEIAKVLIECAPVQILKNDPLPNKICVKCLEKLQVFYDLRKLCIESNYYLWKQVEVNSYFKLESQQILSDTNDNEQNSKIEFDELIIDENQLKDDISSNDDIKNDEHIEESYRNNEEINENGDSKKSSVKKIAYFKKVYPSEEHEGNKNKPSSYIYRFPCPKCNKLFSRKDRLNQHTTKCDGKLKIKKKKIGDKNKDDSYYGKIKKNVQPKYYYRFSCPKCSKILSRKDRLVAHVAKCDGIIQQKASTTMLNDGSNTIKVKRKYSYRFTCAECGKVFSRKSYLQQHVENGCDPEYFKSYSSIKPNPETGMYECNECNNKKFIRKYNLKLHMYRRHKINYPYEKKLSDRKYPCGQCRAIFTKIELLNRHIYNAHNTERQTCEICNKTFKIPRYLRMHKRAVHEGAKKLTCEICGKVLKDAPTLKYHKNAIHFNIKNFKCDLCDKSFVDNTHLKLHKISHLTREERKLYTCEICNQSLMTKKTLKNHQLIHSGERPHKCNYCIKSFRLKRTLAKHIQTIHLQSNF